MERHKLKSRVHCIVISVLFLYLGLSGYLHYVHNFNMLNVL